MNLLFRKKNTQLVVLFVILSILIFNLNALLS